MMAEKKQRRRTTRGGKSAVVKSAGAEMKDLQNKNRSWSVEEQSRNVHVIRFTYSPGWEQYVLLASDVHYDNPHCDRKLFIKHLDQARERDAPVIVPGDLFCLMQGKYDPRKSQTGLRPEHRKEDYLDAVIETTARDLMPYADLFAVICDGNHETNVRNRQGVDMAKRLCRELGCFHGGYRGWIRLLFGHKTGNSNRQSRTIWYSHGSGGGGPVTRGTIQSARELAKVDGADIIVRGHIHEAWVLETPKFALSNAHVPYHKNVTVIQCPTYKDEVGVGAEGWANEKEFPPKPLGGWWLRFSCNNHIVSMTVERAV